MNDIKRFGEMDPARIKSMPRDRVLFRRRPTSLQVGSLFVPETSRYVDRSDLADVIAVGADVTEVKAGDTLLLPDHMDVRGKFTHEGMTYTVIDKEQLGQVAVVEEP